MYGRLKPGTGPRSDGRPIRAKELGSGRNSGQRVEFSPAHKLGLHWTTSLTLLSILSMPAGLLPDPSLSLHPDTPHHLFRGALRNLPEDIFDGISNLDILFLPGNNLTCLPFIPESLTNIDVNLPNCIGLVFSPASVTVTEGATGIYEAGDGTHRDRDGEHRLGQHGLTVVDTDTTTPADQTILSFSPTTWNDPQTVTVAAAEDNRNRHRTFTSTKSMPLRHSATSADYQGLSDEVMVTMIRRTSRCVQGAGF